MVYAVIQYVVVILAAKHMIMVEHVHYVKPAVVELVLLSQLVPRAMVAQALIIGATAPGPARRLAQPPRVPKATQVLLGMIGVWLMLQAIACR